MGQRDVGKPRLRLTIPTKLHFAWPCFPVLEVETSATCGREDVISGFQNKNTWGCMSALRIIRATSITTRSGALCCFEQQRLHQCLVGPAHLKGGRPSQLMICPHLAGSALDHDESSLPDGASLLRERQRRPRISSSIKCMIIVCKCR